MPLLKVFKANIVLAWFFAVTEQACNLANPVLLRWFLGTFSEPTELNGTSSGYELGILMLLVSMLQTFLDAQGLGSNTQALIYFAVAATGDKPTDGVTELNPEGLTAVTGKCNCDLGASVFC